MFLQCGCMSPKRNKSQPPGGSPAARQEKNKRSKVGKHLPEPDDKYVKDAVAKTLREQFPGFTAHQVSSLILDDKSLIQQLTADRISWWKQDERGKHIKLSTEYYDTLRSRYSDCHGDIVLHYDKTTAEAERDLSPQLDEAVEAYIDETRPNRAPLREWFDGVASCTEKEPGK